MRARSRVRGARPRGQEAATAIAQAILKATCDGLRAVCKRTQFQPWLLKKTVDKAIDARAHDLSRDHLPPLAVAAVWAPPAMLPRTKAPSPASSPTRRTWGPAGWRTRAGGRPPRRLRFALCCRQRHGQAERHCPARGIAD
jgi:hypothetical protein